MNRTTLIVAVVAVVLSGIIGFYVGHDRGRKSMAAEFGEMIRNEIPGAGDRMADIEADAARRRGE